MMHAQYVKCKEPKVFEARVSREIRGWVSQAEDDQFMTHSCSDSSGSRRGKEVEVADVSRARRDE